MATTLDFQLRECMYELGKDNRWNVLTLLILHANIRNRCWPSTQTIMRELKLSTSTVVDAGKWLKEHCAIVLVPYKLRVEEEADLPPRQNVYQLTGYVIVDDKRYAYLYSAAADKVSLFETSKFQNSKVSKNGTKVYPSDPPLIEGKGSVDENGSVDPPDSKNLHLSSAPKNGASGSRPRPRNLVFDAIALGSFGLVKVEGKVAKQIGDIAASVKANTAPEHLESLATDLPLMYAWWKETQPDMSAPQKATSILACLKKWRESKIAEWQPELVPND